MSRQLEIRSENRYYLHPQGLKRCTICEEVKPLDNEHFAIHHRNKKGEPVLEGQCKSCRKTYTAALKERQKQDGKWYFQRLLSGIRCRATKEGLAFNLTVDDLQDLWENQNGQCYYTNDPMDLMAFNEGRRSPHHNFPSLDKKVPSNGYVGGNVVWTKWSVNRSKNNLTDREFLEMCRKVVSLHG